MTNIWRVELEEDINGDLILPIPADLLEKLGWKEGDTIHMNLVGECIFLKKIDKVVI